MAVWQQAKVTPCDHLMQLVDDLGAVLELMAAAESDKQLGLLLTLLDPMMGADARDLHRCVVPCLSGPLPVGMLASLPAGYFCRCSSRS